MLSIEKMKSLMPDGDKHSDEEIEKIRDSMYEAAQLMFDVWLHEKNRSKKSKEIKITLKPIEGLSEEEI